MKFNKVHTDSCVWSGKTSILRNSVRKRSAEGWIRFLQVHLSAVKELPDFQRINFQSMNMALTSHLFEIFSFFSSRFNIRWLLRDIVSRVKFTPGEIFTCHSIGSVTSVNGEFSSNLDFRILNEIRLERL